MSLVEAKQSDRSLWILKKNRYQVLAISEDGILLISKPMWFKKSAKNLLALASNLHQHPAVAFGPGATAIPLGTVTDVEVNPGRGQLNLETNDAIHRIMGWFRGPTIIDGGTVRKTKWRSAGRVVNDAAFRIETGIAALQAPLAPQPRSESQDRRDSAKVASFYHQPSLEFLSFIFRFAIGLAMLALSVASFIWPEVGMSSFEALVCGAFGTVVLISQELPAPLTVDDQGITWGRGRKQIHVAWEDVVEFNVAESGQVSVTVTGEHRLRAPRGELVIEPTNFYLDARLHDFLAAIRFYHPELTLTQKTVRPPVLNKPERANKPVIENGKPTWLSRLRFNF